MLAKPRRPRIRRAVAAALVALVCALFLWPGPAAGTVEEQRARLPPPAECSDPVEGVWMSLSYTARASEWYEFTINVRRAAQGSEELKGEISSHYWLGTETDQHPPPCRPSGLELVVKMPGRGKVDKAGKVWFGATTYTTDKVLCGSPLGYNPDNFAGTIDPALQEFQTVNNDGGRFVNEPTVFRRIKCFDPPRKPPSANVTPPSFAPTKRGSGCGL